MKVLIIVCLAAAIAATPVAEPEADPGVIVNHHRPLVYHHPYGFPYIYGQGLPLTHSNRFPLPYGHDLPLTYSNRFPLPYNQGHGYPSGFPYAALPRGK